MDTCGSKPLGVNGLLYIARNYQLIQIGELMMNEENWAKMCSLIGEMGSDQNSLQILEQDRRETVLVNALAYFLHPRRGGRTLKNKILENLTKHIDGKKYGDEDSKKSTGELLCMTTEFPCYESLEKIEVKPKRIDLFLEFDNYCIGIEAKVDADLKNDLKVYRKNVKKRAKSWGKREYDTILLLTEVKKKKLLNNIKKYPENIREKWPIITWGEITNGCDLTVSNRNVDSESDLLQALIEIDKGKKNEFDSLIEQTVKLDAKAAKLKEGFDKSGKKGGKCFIWSGERKIRHIVEPRVVIEYPEDKFKIDVCVGFRGVQFIIFNYQKYNHKLYTKLCKEYSFFFWQDYSDPIEHFDRYLLSEEAGDDSKTGPQLPENNRKSVEEENTVFYKDKFNQESDDWIGEAIKEINKILLLKDV